MEFTNEDKTEIDGTIYPGKDIIQWENHYDMITAPVNLNDTLLIYDAWFIPSATYLILDDSLLVQDVRIIGRVIIVPNELCKELQKLVRSEKNG